MFTLGALSFVVAALAVGVLGIETQGLALEALASTHAADDDARDPAGAAAN